MRVHRANVGAQTGWEFAKGAPVCMTGAPSRGLPPRTHPMPMKTLRLLMLIVLTCPALHAQTATQVWAKRYNGPANNLDYAAAAAVDGAGNVIVTGQSLKTSGNFDYYTAKYAFGTGALLWEKRYEGVLNGTDVASSMVIDSAGNAVVAGYSYNASGDSDCYTAKYAATDGALLWEKRYNGTGNSHDYAWSVAVDGAGNVAVTGQSIGSGSNYDYYTAKYAAADGALLWERSYNGPDNSSDAANSVVVDSAGNVVVTGSSRGASSNDDYYTAKYAAADGALLWEARYVGPGLGSEVANSVAVDAAGNVVVTGYSIGPDSNSNYYTAKYAAANGALLWEARYDGTGNGNDYAWSVAVDGAGNVVVTGSSRGASNNDDYYTAKYDAADGALLWEKRYNGPGNSADTAVSVAVDSVGHVVVTGSSRGASSNDDYYTAKYAAADGALIWEARYNGPANSRDVMTNRFPYTGKLALTADGGAVVTGQSVGSGTNYDYATVRYTPPPLYQWKLTRLGDAAAPDDGDTDFDGLRTILEYATGGDPLVPGALPAVSTVAGKLTLTFPRNTAATDVTLTVQASDDLSTWTNLASSTGGSAMAALVAGVNVAESGSGALRTVEVRDLFLTSDPAHPRRFLRLHATP